MIRLDYLFPNTFDNLVDQLLVVLMKRQRIQCSNQNWSLITGWRVVCPLLVMGIVRSTGDMGINLRYLTPCDLGSEVVSCGYKPL